MTVTFTNQGWLVLTGVEKLLEDEFGGGATVYFSDIFIDQNRRAIRLDLLPSEQLSRIAGLTTDRYNVEVNLEYPVSASKRKSLEKAVQMLERIKRVLINNCAYAPSTTYRWHDGLVEAIDHDPERETDDEGDLIPPKKVVDLKQLVWGVTVSEGVAAA